MRWQRTQAAGTRPLIESNAVTDPDPARTALVMALLAWLQNGAATSYGKPSPAQATEIAGLLATGKLSQ
jgi:hypothetical protein